MSGWVTDLRSAILPPKFPKESLPKQRSYESQVLVRYGQARIGIGVGVLAVRATLIIHIYFPAGDQFG